MDMSIVDFPMHSNPPTSVLEAHALQSMEAMLAKLVSTQDSRLHTLLQAHENRFTKLENMCMSLATTVEKAFKLITSENGTETQTANGERLSLLETNLERVTKQLERLESREMTETREQTPGKTTFIQQHEQEEGQASNETNLTKPTANQPDATTPVSNEKTTLPHEQDTPTPRSNNTEGTPKTLFADIVKGHPTHLQEGIKDMIKSSSRYQRLETPTVAHHKSELSSNKRLIYVTGWARCQITEIKGRFRKAYFSLRRILNLRWVGLTTLEVLVSEDYSQEFMFKMKKLDGYLTTTTQYDLLKSPNAVDNTENRRIAKQRFVRSLLSQIESTTKEDVALFFFDLIKEQGVFTLQAAEALLRKDIADHPNKDFSATLALFKQKSAHDSEGNNQVAGPSNGTAKGTDGENPVADNHENRDTPAKPPSLVWEDAGATQESRMKYLVETIQMSEQQQESIRALMEPCQKMSTDTPRLQSPVEIIIAATEASDIAARMIHHLTADDRDPDEDSPMSLISSLANKILAFKQWLTLTDGTCKMGCQADMNQCHESFLLHQPMEEAELLNWLDYIEPRFTTAQQTLAEIFIETCPLFDNMRTEVGKWKATWPQTVAGENDKDSHEPNKPDHDQTASNTGANDGHESHSNDKSMTDFDQEEDGHESQMQDTEENKPAEGDEERSENNDYPGTQHEQEEYENTDHSLPDYEPSENDQGSLPSDFGVWDNSKSWADDVPDSPPANYAMVLDQ
jgi:hypothetical protein